MYSCQVAYTHFRGFRLFTCMLLKFRTRQFTNFFVSRVFLSGGLHVFQGFLPFCVYASEIPYTPIRKFLGFACILARSCMHMNSLALICMYEFSSGCMHMNGFAAICMYVFSWGCMHMNGSALIRMYVFSPACMHISKFVRICMYKLFSDYMHMSMLVLMCMYSPVSDCMHMNDFAPICMYLSNVLLVLNILRSLTK